MVGRLPVATHAGIYTPRACRFHSYSPPAQLSHPDNRLSSPSAGSNGYGCPYPIPLSGPSTGSNGYGFPYPIPLSGPSAGSNGYGFPYPIPLSDAH